MVRPYRVAPLFVLIAAGTALAQGPEGTVQTPAPAAPAEPLPDTPPASVQGGVPGQLDPDGTYTIKDKDTLWDLSQQFLSNPWYWPKIWADNPQVENPHWIYPGNRLKIRTGADGLPGEIGPDEGPSDFNGPQAEGLQTKRPELADVSAGTIGQADSFGSEQDVVTIAGNRNLVGSIPDVLRVRVPSVITGRELADMGAISNSFEQKGMLSTYDKVYVSFTKLDAVKIGQRYSIFRLRAPVVHPVSKQTVGIQSDLLGTLRIISKENGLAVAELGNVIADVSRGDRVGPSVQLDRTVKASPNTTNVTGVVLTTDTPKLTAVGEHQLVFIDKGSKESVAEGNTFRVVQEGDGLSALQLAGVVAKISDMLPSEPIATLVVIDVRDHTCSAMITRSVREVNIGDRVEMKVPPPPMAGAGGDVQ